MADEPPDTGAREAGVAQSVERQICTLQADGSTPSPGPINACDTCPAPGACCKDFPLIGGPDSQASALPTLLHAMVWAAQQTYVSPEQDRQFLALPFIPHERDEASGLIWWHCVNLLPNGRCGDYDNRPYGPCVNYEPGQDKICALHADFEK